MIRFKSSFRDGPKDQTPDAQLSIGESRDSGFVLRTPRNDVASRLLYFFAAAARSTKVLPPFILWASGASLIWITTASASTPRFLTSAWVMSRIMPAFCSSVRPAAMLTVISGIVFSPFVVLSLAHLPHPSLPGLT